MVNVRPANFFKIDEQKTYKRSEDGIVILPQSAQRDAHKGADCHKASCDDGEDESNNEEFVTTTFETGVTLDCNRNRSHSERLGLCSDVVANRE